MCGMPGQDGSEATTDTIFQWDFNDVKDLKRGLQQYLDFLDGTVTTHYGLTRGERDPDPRVHLDAARRRSEIDACMNVLQELNPFLWRVLDVHYRWGAGMQPRGWTITAACIGLRRATCPPGVRCVLPEGPINEEDRRPDLPDCPGPEQLQRASVGWGCLQDREVLCEQLGIATRRLFLIHRARQDKRS